MTVDTTSTTIACSLAATAEMTMIDGADISGRINVVSGLDSIVIRGVLADSLIGDTTQDATHQSAMNLWRKGPSPGSYSP
jgi:hypothetical protein